MLHLISDFSVVTVRENDNQTTPNVTSTIGTQFSDDLDCKVERSGASNVDLEKMDTNADQMESSTSTTKVDKSNLCVHPQRVLSVIENDRHHTMRARVSIGAPDLAIVATTTDPNHSTRLNASNLSRPIHSPIINGYVEIWF